MSVGVEVLKMACVWMLLGRSLLFCENDSLAIVSKTVNSNGLAGGNGTMLIVMLLHIAMLWLSVISLVFILYHWWFSEVTV